MILSPAKVAERRALFGFDFGVLFEIADGGPRQTCEPVLCMAN